MRAHAGAAVRTARTRRYAVRVPHAGPPTGTVAACGLTLLLSLACVLPGSTGCGLAPREGIYQCDPEEQAPACPTGWFCHHGDRRCWSEPEDGWDVPLDAPEIDAGDGTDIPDEAADETGPDDGSDEGEADAARELCNGLDDDGDGLTDERIWCMVAEVLGNADLFAVWGSSAADIWVVGDGGTILHWDGSTWSPAASPTATDLRGAWVAPTTEAWAVGPANTIIRWDGTSWSDDPSGIGCAPYDVWGTDADHVWVVGGPGRILYRYSGTWTEEPSGVMSGGRIYGVWGEAGQKAFAVGENSIIRDRDLPSGGWAIRLPPEWLDMYAVGGSSAEDVWVVGIGGAILHGPVAPYVRMESPTSSHLRGVWAVSFMSAWAVGDGGTIVRWDGATWTPDDSGTTAGLKGIWGDSMGELWTVGAAGTILRRRP